MESITSDAYQSLNWGQKLAYFKTKYANHLKVLKELASRCSQGVIIVYVPGHSGISHNEIADILAKVAVWCKKHVPEEKIIPIVKKNIDDRKKKDFGTEKVAFVNVPFSAKKSKKLHENQEEILNPKQEIVWKSGQKNLEEVKLLAIAGISKGQVKFTEEIIKKMEMKETLLYKEIIP